jgi:hypothetical protein
MMSPAERQRLIDQVKDEMQKLTVLIRFDQGELQEILDALNEQQHRLKRFSPSQLKKALDNVRKRRNSRTSGLSRKLQRGKTSPQK